MAGYSLPMGGSALTHLWNKVFGDKPETAPASPSESSSGNTLPVEEVSSSLPDDAYAEASSGGVCIAPAAGPACGLWAAGSMETQRATPAAKNGEGGLSDRPVGWGPSEAPSGDSFGEDLVNGGFVPPEAEASGAGADTDYCPGPSEEGGPANTHVDNPGQYEDPLEGVKDALRPPRAPNTDDLYGEQPKAPPEYGPRPQVDPDLALLYGVTTVVATLYFPNTDIAKDIPQPKPEQSFVVGAAAILGAAAMYTALTMAPAAVAL